MANPTKGWDKVPIFGWYMELDGVTPKVGQVKLTLAQRVTSTNGRTIFPGGTIIATLGGTDNDTAVLNQVRAAMSAVDQAAVEAGGGTFDAAAWGANWDARLPGAFFTSFPASDDPDIVETGFQVKIEEKLQSTDGKIYYITPLLSMLDAPIPGLNVGTIAVPPGSPTAPAPIYAKGKAGGVASLDATGLVPLEQLPDIGGGVSSFNDLTDVPAVLAAGDTEAEARAAIGAADATVVVPNTRTVAGKPLSDDVTLGRGDVGLGSVDNTSDAAKPISTAAATALSSRLNWRGDYVDGGTYAVNDVVNSPGFGSYKCLQAHTSSGGAPNVESPFWHKIGGTSNLQLGATATDAKAGNWKPATSDITDATTVGQAVVKAATATAGREGLKIFVVQPDADPADYDDDAILYYLAAATLTIPTMKGYTSVSSATGTTNVVVDPAVGMQGTSVSVGDWMLMTYMGGAAVAPTTPTGWVVVADLGHFNTQYAIVYGRIRQAGDTSYNVTIQSAVNGSRFALLWGASADATITNWLAGAVQAASGSVTSITAPAVTTAAPSLVLTVAFEASTVNETDVASITGATKWFFIPQSNATGAEIHTLTVGYVEQSAAGATSGVTVTYPNSSPNEAAVQIALPS